MRKTLSILVLLFAFAVIPTAAQNELFNKGLQQYEAKQYQASAETFQQVVTQNPQFYQAHYNLGLALYYLERFNDAVSAFQKSTAISPTYTRAWYWTGMAFAALLRYDEAIAAYQKTIELDNSYANANYRLGLIYQTRKQFPEAERFFKRTLELLPNADYAKTELGNVYVSQRRFPEAIAVFVEVLRTSPASSNAYLGLGNAYYNDSRWVDSIPHYRKAAELTPNWATPQLYLGDAYLKVKNFAAAIPAYEESIRLDPKRPDAYYGLGLTFVSMADKVRATQTAARLKPLDAVKAATLEAEIAKLTTPSTGTNTIKPQPKAPPKNAQRIKDEQEVARMADLGFDAAVVTAVSSIRDSPKPTGRVLLAVKRGDFLSLVGRDGVNNWFQVVDEKTGIEGWIDGKVFVGKLTTNPVTGPALVESGKAVSTATTASVVISNMEDKTTLSIRVNGTLYKIPPKSTKTLALPPGKMTYYGWSPGIRPATGSSTLERGKQYDWSFKINR